LVTNYVIDQDVILMCNQLTGARNTTRTAKVRVIDKAFRLL